MLVGLLIFIAIAACFMVGGFLGAVWVPIKQVDLESLRKNLNFKKGMKVIEFGSGDGRFLKFAAKQGASALGYEINPLLWLYTKTLFTGNRLVKVRLGSAWTKPFGEADVVFAFLMPKFMKQLEKKLNNELKPGAIAVTYVFKLPGKKHYKLENNCYYYKF